MKMNAQPQVSFAGVKSPVPLAAKDKARVQAAREAFRQFHAHCFWNLRADLEITSAEVPMIADGLRRNGGRAGFLLAARLCP